MMKNTMKCVCLVAAALLVFASCQETKEANEWDNKKEWRIRNWQFFADTLAYARQEVQMAKQQYGNDWEQHCDWRVYRSYAVTDEVTPSDSNYIAVKILEKGTGSGCPLYTDSVRCNYRGRLIPTTNYEEGYVFDHSGLYTAESEVFNPALAVPTTFGVSNLVVGFTTALQYMHIGDKWRIFIPYSLAYGETAQTSIPAFSTLRFDVQLKQYARAGESLPTWH